MDKLTVEQAAEFLRSRGHIVRKCENRYDRRDRIRRVSAIIAGPMKLAAYQVRDPETDEWSPLQFHVTFDNHVMAVMSHEAAKLFARFVTDIAEPTSEEPPAA